MSLKSFTYFKLIFQAIALADKNKIFIGMKLCTRPICKVPMSIIHSSINLLSYLFCKIYCQVWCTILRHWGYRTKKKKNTFPSLKGVHSLISKRNLQDNKYNIVF